MNRRETIKTIMLGSLAVGSVGSMSLLLEGCSPADRKIILKPLGKFVYGRTETEKLRDKELFKAVFFKEHELSTIANLCDVILPSSADAGLVEFVEFIVKDMSYQQKPIREGLVWLDEYSNKLYRLNFIDCSEKEQSSICDHIAYPEKTLSELKQGEAFFTRMRNLTLTGYFTSKMGVKDLGYKGNTPNVWDGIPQDVLDDHELKYEEDWLAKCIDQSKRGDIAVWDKNKNLIN